ncbi:agamous-like MADS-box protein AGL31 isoform X2 [Arabidopsis lyrata subsp. lyrata]|uniref:agamous-like MADS-box protein AGL31 isoform X2 n=1 Tax=Arabidopsis lyrata subsp. lyrata TaxID=81972 RepID=UPI000A29CD29|nr:agamous-like MADS-box protein AGL31 isoform X2 [Arabidopsis lyrata subsp. lyrata]|eukprot:XP_020872032.1 agamous-like MADS-box protein AGL31 isoform X2 [Arabidopsis lyrata subsp. lyrata]
MGRRKVEIERIENKSSRQVTFSKRRKGLIEKARQLSILCESSIAVLAVSGSGKLYNAASGDNMSKIIDRYEIHQADELKALDLAEKIRNYLPHKEILEIVQSVDSLISMEEQLETTLSVIRAKKTELMMEEVKSLQETEMLLREENQILASHSQLGKNTFLVTEGERGMARENGSGNKVPETLALLK